MALYLDFFLFYGLMIQVLILLVRSFAMLTAWGLSFLFVQLNLLQWLILSIIIVITGTLGDLVESMLKRSLGIKDSGNILPGHGGMLDRFDAVLISAPFVFVYLALFCR